METIAAPVIASSNGRDVEDAYTDAWARRVTLRLIRDAEIARDRSLRLAPVDLATAQEMIDGVRGLVPLSGYRGRPKGDLDALARAIVAMSLLAHDPGIAEAEINPLIVRPEGQGVVAVDALVKLAGNA